MMMITMLIWDILNGVFTVEDTAIVI